MKFFKSALRRAAFLLAAFILILIPSKVYSNLPEIIVDETYYNIEVDRRDTFFLYLPYGNPTLDKEIKNVSLSIEIKSKSIEIVKEDTFDLYYSKSDNQNVQIPACNGTYSGPKNLLDPKVTISSAQKIIYGPQSAYKGGEVSGSTSSTLDPKAVGCMEVGLKLTDEAEEGQVVEVVYNPDSYDSSDYPLDLKPAKQTIKIYIGQKLDCNNNQEVINGSCENKCTESQVRNDLGVCTERVKTCEEGYDLFDGECLEGCAEDESRNTFGSCAKKQEPQNEIVSLIINSLIVLTFLIFILTIFLKIRSIIKRKGF